MEQSLRNQIQVERIPRCPKPWFQSNVFFRKRLCALNSFCGETVVFNLKIFSSVNEVGTALWELALRDPAARRLS